MEKTGLLSLSLIPLSVFPSFLSLFLRATECFHFSEWTRAQGAPLLTCPYKVTAGQPVSDRTPLSCTVLPPLPSLPHSTFPTFPTLRLRLAAWWPDGLHHEPTKDQVSICDNKYSQE